MIILRDLPVARIAILLLALSCSPVQLIQSADWPMWRYDAARGGASPEQLTDSLHLQWVLELPEPRTAWPSNQEKLQFDRLYEPILVGKKLFVPSMIRDKVTAYHTDTGEEIWRFYAQGPVRFAPVAWRDKLYFVSDDGYLYCLLQEDGSLVWKFRGGPSDRRVLGNERVVSMWPARGAPVIADDVIYFGASIWPFMGIFLYAMEPESGKVIWANTGDGTDYITQQHGSPAFAGVTPQGYIAANEDQLIVAGGRTVPASYDRSTGKFLHFNVGSRVMGSKGGGGYAVTAGRNFILNRGAMYRLTDGKWVANIDSPIMTKHSMIGLNKEGLRGYRLGYTEVESKDKRGKVSRKMVIKGAWSADLDEKVQKLFLKSGSHLFCRGEKNQILAVSLPSLDEGARVTWRVSLPDEPLNLITGDKKLFVSTALGRIYCFGSQDRGLKIEKPASKRLELISRGSSWKFDDSGKARQKGWNFLAFGDASWDSGEAPLGYGDEGLKTTLSFGGNDKKKHITTFFRRNFEVSKTVDLVSLELAASVDDGAVFYLDGKEIGRLNMPAGDVKDGTLARSGGDENKFRKVDVSKLTLAAGSHVLAVEVHQTKVTSSDIRFDLEFLADAIAHAPPGEIAKTDAEARVGALVRHAGARSGYCVALGLSSGRWIEEIVRQSDLHVFVVDSNAEKIDAFRRRMDEKGLYGVRVAAMVADPESLILPQYFAELIIAEDPVSVGLRRSSGSSRSGGLRRARSFVERVFRSLRPYSGVAAFPLGRDDRVLFETAAKEARLDRGKVERAQRLTWLKRLGPPTGSGQWTHQYGDASNSVVSNDSVVRAPLGILWFGGPSNEGVLPRHGHGPNPHVVAGRIFIEGRDIIRCLDSYTGRLVWERKLKDVGKNYDYTSHEPGANALGSNYVSLEDAVYVAYGNQCLMLDSSTGETVKSFDLREIPGLSDTAEWGYIAVYKNFLIGGVKTGGKVAPIYTRSQVSGLKDDALKKAIARVKSWLDFKPADDQAKKDQIFVLQNINKLLLEKDLVAKIPGKVREAVKDKKKRDVLETQLAEYYKKSGGEANDYDALVLKRKLMTLYYSLPAYKEKALGTFDSTARTGSSQIIVFDRNSGKLHWTVAAGHEFRHNAVAVGGGAIYLLDRMPDWEKSYFSRRGLKADENSRLVALDIARGNELWSTRENIFGTWLSYSEKYDILVQAGSKGRDRSRDESENRIAAYRGASGEPLWKSDKKYEGPVLLLDDLIITQGHSASGHSLSLMTGERIQVKHPISGERVDWGYSRNYGCNTAIGSQNLLTFRSAAAAFYDLLSESGTSNLGGFRSGCTSNLIPADGIICAPDYTRTCTCSYQNQVSLALVHMPEVEVWSFQKLTSEAAQVQRVGINFGAPGDRRGTDGTLWLDYPSRGGPSPDIAVEMSSDRVRYARQHASMVSEGTKKWVASSAVRGNTEIAVSLVTLENLVIVNEVPGGPELKTRDASFALSVAEESVPRSGLRNSRSLKSRGTKNFDARVEGHASLVSSSVTVEFWAKIDTDFVFVDARGGDASKAPKDRPRQGFAIGFRDTKVAYYVEAAKGKVERREIATSKKIPDNRWTHVAWTYDAESGVGALYFDGEEVGRNEGTDAGPLHWNDEKPGLFVARKANSHTSIDELRICDTALSPDQFLHASRGENSEAESTENVLGYWRMESHHGKSAAKNTYTVRLIFADMEGLESGGRQQDVYLQNRMVLEKFDIAQEAGGPYREIIKEFRNVEVIDKLFIRIEGVGDSVPLLSGVQVIRTSEF